ncbi:Enterobactin outer-membrane receptor [Fusobacterium necrophorum subsp. necrophorum]|nr:Enterobactin outer-membrane receptor [Fusobacterium necrophorum subsp. necrophorum]
MIDGVPVNMLDSSHRKVPLNTVNPNQIERIEVIPGGGAVLYGNGTAGGVINILTKKHRGILEYRLSLWKFGDRKYDIAAGTSLGTLTLLLIIPMKIKTATEEILLPIRIIFCQNCL